MKKLSLFVMSLLMVNNAQAAKHSPLEMVALMARLGGSALLAGLGTIAFSAYSPNVSKLGTAAVLGTTTMLAARLVCGADINKKGITIPVISKIPDFPELPAELNWFNVTVLAGATLLYGLYHHGGALLTAYKNLIEQQ